MLTGVSRKLGNLESGWRSPALLAGKRKSNATRIILGAYSVKSSDGFASSRMHLEVVKAHQILLRLTWKTLVPGQSRPRKWMWSRSRLRGVKAAGLSLLDRTYRGPVPTQKCMLRNVNELGITTSLQLLQRPHRASLLKKWNLQPQPG